MIITQPRRPTIRNLRRLALLIAAVLVVVIVLTVGVSTATRQAPPTIVLSPTATQPADALTFEQAFVEAIRNRASDGSFHARVDAQQLVDWLLIKAPEYAQSQKQPWPFKDTKIAFGEGTIALNATLVAAGWPEAPVQLTLKPGIAVDGSFVITVTGAQMGILGVPGPLLSQITAVVQDAVQGQLKVIHGLYRLTKLTVHGGNTEVSGYLVYF